MLSKFQIILSFASRIAATEACSGTQTAVVAAQPAALCRSSEEGHPQIHGCSVKNYRFYHVMLPAFYSFRGNRPISC